MKVTPSISPTFSQPVRQRLVGAERGDRGLARHLVEIGHGQRREHVLGVVRADQVRPALLEHLLAARHEPAVDQLVIGRRRPSR